METTEDILIVIPARYASTRLPGKPLVRIAGREMILRVTDIARHVCARNENCSYVVATDDSRIADFCREHGVAVVITSDECRSGTERCWDAVGRMERKPGFIVNLQGDNPLCPPWFIEQMIAAWRGDSAARVFTPCLRLSWDELDALRKAKEKTPFSGTTVLVDKAGYAMAFSKNIVPAIRKEDRMRASGPLSPVHRHIGLYGYAFDALRDYFTMEPSPYEEAEGLEQMRFLHNRIPVRMVEVDYRGRKSASGVDSPEDVERVEAIIAECGEFDLSL